MLVFSSILFFLTSSYCLGLFFLKHGLNTPPKASNSNKPFLSIIVSARNEEKNIEACIEHLLNQDYSQTNYEIIIVDDRSEDKTAEIVRKFISGNCLKLIRIPLETQTVSPKKNAIATAIKQAKGEIIITTDADCTPPETWLSILTQNFAPNIGMVAGFNPYKIQSRNFFQKILALDYFSMAAVAAATAGLNFPVSCTGGNLAYRKQAYEEVGGFAQHQGLTSGDDDLFLEQLRENTKWEIVYCTDPKSFVPTEPPESLQAFAHQRIRYASKGRYYKWNVSSILIMVYCINLFLAAGPVIVFFQPKFLLVFLSSFILKIMSEFIFLKNAAKKFNYPLSKPLYFLTSIYHPIYITLAGLAGQLFAIEWKGQKYKKRSIVIHK